MKYRFIDQGDRPWKSDEAAQVIGAALSEISTREGALSPQAVVDEARPEEAPLHPYFEWDDSIAGESWRRQQASTLIRCIRIVKGEDANAEPILERPFIRIKQPTNTASAYYPAATVMSSAELRQLAINDAIAFLSRAQSKLKEYRELEKQYRAIEKISDELVSVNTRIRARAGAQNQADALQRV